MRRAGRRRRQRRNKARMADQMWRRWSWRMRGSEFRAMSAFVDQWKPGEGFAAEINGERVFVDPRQRHVELATLAGIDFSTPVVHRVFRVERQREGRFFYHGQNRRERWLKPRLVEVR